MTADIPSWLKLNVVVTATLLGSVIGGTVTATMGYQNIMNRLDRYDAAIFGAASDRTEPGLKADMKSVDQRFIGVTQSLADLKFQLDVVKAQEAYRLGAAKAGKGLAP